MKISPNTCLPLTLLCLSLAPLHASDASLHKVPDERDLDTVTQSLASKTNSDTENNEPIASLRQKDHRTTENTIQKTMKENEKKSYQEHDQASLPKNYNELALGHVKGTLTDYPKRQQEKITLLENENKQLYHKVDALQRMLDNRAKNQEATNEFLYKELECQREEIETLKCCLKVTSFAGMMSVLWLGCSYLGLDPKKDL